MFKLTLGLTYRESVCVYGTYILKFSGASRVALVRKKSKGCCGGLAIITVLTIVW